MRYLTPLSSGQPPTAGFGCIVPPYLVDRLAGSDDPALSRAGRHTQAVQATLRGRRETRATRHPGEDRVRRASPRGFVPQVLRQRVHPPAPADEVSEVVTPAVSPSREVYDAEHRCVLPGALRRTEGAGPHADESVSEAYDGPGSREHQTVRASWAQVEVTPADVTGPRTAAGARAMPTQPRQGES